jgi:hypothetical protein
LVIGRKETDIKRRVKEKLTSLTQPVLPSLSKREEGQRGIGFRINEKYL